MFPKSKKRKIPKEEPTIIESKSINKNYKYSLEELQIQKAQSVEKLKEIENLDKPETQTTLTSELIETIGKIAEITIVIIQTTFLLTCI